MRSLIINITVTLALSSSAHAFTTLNTTPGGTSLAGEGLVTAHAGAFEERFNSTNGPTTCVPTNGLGVDVLGQQGNQYDLATDTVFHRRAAPTGDTSCFLSTGATHAKEDLVLDFAQATATTPLTYFGLYWGSIDPYNHIAFFDSSGVAVDFANGLGAQLDGTTVASLTNVALYTSNYIEFSFDPLDKVTRAVISTDNYAFELDNIAYTVANAGAAAVAANAGAAIRVGEPAGALMLTFSMVAVASSRMRKIRGNDTKACC